MSAPHEPSPAAAAVIARYGRCMGNLTASNRETQHHLRDFMVQMRAMQRELIQAYLPDMGLEEALRAARTLDALDALDWQEEVQAAAGRAGGVA